MFRRTLYLAGLALVILTVIDRLREPRSVFASCEFPQSERPADAAAFPNFEADEESTPNALVPTVRESETASADAARSNRASSFTEEAYRSEVRVRVYFDGAVEAGSSLTGSGNVTERNWRDSASPACGRLRFTMVEEDGELGTFETTADLDEEGVAVFALPEAWTSRLESLDAQIHTAASLTVAPGLKPLPAVQLDRATIFEVVEFAFAVEAGFVLRGRVAGSERTGPSAVAHVVPGRVAPADLAEWEGNARLRSHARREELLHFTYSSSSEAPGSFVVGLDGTFGPLWLPRAQAAWIAIAGPRGFGTWRAELPVDLKPGAVWSVGPVELSAPTALELRVVASGATVPAGCRLAWRPAEDTAGGAAEPALARTPTRFSDYEPVLQAVDSTLAKLLYDSAADGVALTPGEGGSMRLAPLPPVAVEGDLEVILPDGRRTAPVRVDLIPGRTTQLEIDLADHFAVGDLRGVCLNGRVLWEDGEPAVGVILEHTGLGAAAQATTDDAGRFIIEGLAPSREHAFQLTGWDVKSPHRVRWRLAALPSDPEGLDAALTTEDRECARVDWTLERPRYLSVRGLELPAGAFADAEPIEWVLQELGLDGGWSSYPVEVVELLDRGRSREVRVSLPSARTGPRRLRVVAVWSPVYTTASHPVEMHPRGPSELTSWFETELESPEISITGIAYDAQGNALAGTEVHALSACSSRSPSSIQTDRLGGFRFDGVRVKELLLFVAGEGAVAERRIDPRITSFVEMRLR